MHLCYLNRFCNSGNSGTVEQWWASWGTGPRAADSWHSSRRTHSSKASSYSSSSSSFSFSSPSLSPSPGCDLWSHSQGSDNEITLADLPFLPGRESKRKKKKAGFWSYGFIWPVLVMEILKKTRWVQYSQPWHIQKIVLSILQHYILGPLQQHCPNDCPGSKSWCLGSWRRVGGSAVWPLTRHTPFRETSTERERISVQL